MSHSIGIDLGTTYSVCAVLTDDEPARVLPISQPVNLAENIERRASLRSAVALAPDGKTVYVGEFAASLPNAIRSIKMKMGRPWAYRAPNGDRWYPEDISGLILNTIRKEIEQVYGEENPEAIITVPASFGTEQRAATVRAAHVAGFRMQEKLLKDEPVAALLSRLAGQKHDLRRFEKPEVYMVFDFGGGTLDVSILRVQSGGTGLEVHMLGRSRYTDLGGDDLDESIAAYCLALFDQSHPFEGWGSDEKRELAQAFCRVSEELKKGFSQRREAPITQTDHVDRVFSVPSLPRSESFETNITAKDLERVVERFFDPDTPTNIFHPVNEALENANRIETGFQMSSIDRLFLVGGSSFFYLVPRALQNFFRSGTEKEPVIEYLHSDRGSTEISSVALGAATWKHAIDSGQVHVSVHERLFESLFAEQNGAFLPTVPHHATLDGEWKSTEECVLRMDEPSTHVRLPLYRGAHENDRNMDLWTVGVARLPEVAHPEEDSFTVQYRVLPSKTVELRLSNNRTGQTTMVDLNRQQFEGGAIEDSRSRIANMNINPKE